MGTPFSQPQVEEAGRRWISVVIGAAVVVVAIVALVLLGRPGAKPALPAVAPYAEELRISDLKLSAAENFVGGSVNYVDGKITNVGQKTVSAATVETVFRNSLGEVVQREAQPLMLYHTGLAGFPDVAPLSAAPLTPNQTRDFRLTFEHISSDWDHGYPELRFVQITAK
jgi:Protein of unknown function (DUF2393)